MNGRPDPRPLIVHVVYRFDTGGLENGMVNLINRLPVEAYRHRIVSLTAVTDFRRRVRRADVEFLALDKPPGHALRLYPRLYRLFREWHPAIVHTRNLAALEAAIPAWAAGVPVRLHGEHGRDIGDLDGGNRKYQWVRRLHRPFVTRYIALSHDLEHYLCRDIGIAPERVAQIYNGVDTQVFRPLPVRQPIAGCPFGAPAEWLVGTVGRMQAVKDQLNLARAFVLAWQIAPALRGRLRLVMVGEGPLRLAAQEILNAAGIAHLAWLPGERQDIPAILQGLDCFALPSLSEGISNTLLEAMACGLPVIATAVGGNGELVAAGESGHLVPPGDAQALALQMVRLACNPSAARAMGRAGRLAAERRFSLEAMLKSYGGLYDQLLAAAARRRPEEALARESPSCHRPTRGIE